MIKPPGEIELIVESILRKANGIGEERSDRANTKIRVDLNFTESGLDERS
jgi:hypothetical protein